MKVLLKKDIENLGYVGDICEVSPGYGRNFLIPKGFAVAATASTLKEAEVWKHRTDARRDQLQAQYAALTERINKTVLEFEARAGDTGKLYGSITTAEVVAKLNETIGVELDRRRIVNNANLRTLGEHEVRIRLDPTNHARFKVLVNREGAAELAAAQAAAEAEAAALAAAEAAAAEAEVADAAETVEAAVETIEAAVEPVADAATEGE